MKKFKLIIKKFFKLFGFEILNFNNNLTLDIHLKYLFNRNNYDLVIDVGANEGQFGLLCRNIGYKGLIISFEPVTKTFSNLVKHQSDNWHCYNFALGSENGSRELKIYNSSLFSSFLDISDYGSERFINELSTHTTQIVNIYTLDEILKNYPKFNNIFLKMDTQGFDLEVFEGATCSLERIFLILSEISINKIYKDSPNYKIALDKYESKGFKISGLFPMNFNDDGSIVELDAVLIKSK